MYLAMYDICKNNQRVAKLHLIKTAHRLGEPVIGVLDFSEALLTTYKASELKDILRTLIHPNPTNRFLYF